MCSNTTEINCTICSAPVCAAHRVEHHWCPNCIAEYRESRPKWLPETLALVWFMARKRGTGGAD